MENKHNPSLFSYLFSAGTVFVVLFGIIWYQEFELVILKKRVQILTTDLASTNVVIDQNTHVLAKSVTDLAVQTQGISSTLTNTRQNVDAVKNEVGGVKQSVGSISDTVGTLQKLSKTDPELLKKYSKVYFMNENYVPAHLLPVPQDYVYSSTRQEQFLNEAWPHLKDLMDAAKAAGVTLYVKSSYRSFAEQKSLKSAYSVTYGAGTANSFSADQGYSEHQLGTTLDFITTGLGGQLDGFDNTKAYQWLTDNAYRFGFELSYPKGNKYYIYEPWHWRYVGVKLATYLHQKGINFYDLDQREIDSYLVNLYD
jgi:LAS superfamily LD-carboxypeptidase LdcB